MEIRQKSYVILSGILICAILAGCNSDKKRDLNTSTAPAPAYIEGTIAEFATLSSGVNIPLQGYGLAIGLGENGSSEVPAHLRKYMIEYLSKQNLGSWRHGTEELTPSRVLSDIDTAVVLVGGSIYPGAPEDMKFDIYVAALPKTQTRSLEGGVLMPTELRLAWHGQAAPGGPTLPWAQASGPIFVNPFIDTSKPENLSKALEGRVIGGGKITEYHSVLLQLYYADYARSNILQNVINERFAKPREKIANAKTPSIVEINIPEEYKKNHIHFLRLLMHLPVRSGAAQAETHARRIADAIQQPEADCEELALVWEAIGRQTLPIVRTIYASSNPAASFYAARAGMRMGDVAALDIVARFAQGANGNLQLPAIEALGEYRSLQAVAVLQELLDSRNELVRVGAYESLLKQGATSRIKQIDVDGQFRIDVVTSSRDYVIYATQSIESKIVLFGRDMEVNRPIFFNAPADSLVVSADEGAKKLKMFRKIPRNGHMSPSINCDFVVSSLIQALGSVPHPDTKGEVNSLGLTYSQVVSALYRMCKQGDISAKFVLQPPPAVQKIYKAAPTTGRPDMPG